MILPDFFSYGLLDASAINAIAFIADIYPEACVKTIHLFYASE
jgi:hypothetical protein